MFSRSDRDKSLGRLIDGWHAAHDALLSPNCSAEAIAAKSAIMAAAELLITLLPGETKSQILSKFLLANDVMHANGLIPEPLFTSGIADLKTHSGSRAA